MGMRDNWLKRVVGWLLSVLLGRVTIPAWIAIAMAIFLGVPAWSEAVHFWLETAKTTPTWAAPAAAIIANQYFPPGLALFGVFYLVVVGYEGTDIVRHKIVPVTGWIVVGVCFLAIILMAGYGWLELALRTAHDEGAAGIERGTPSDNTTSHPQRPLSTESRVLQPDQIRILLQELPDLRKFISSILIASTKDDNDTVIVAEQYIHLFIDNGIDANRTERLPAGPEDNGLLIEVPDKNNPPLSAQKLREIFHIADINTELRQVKDKSELYGHDFVLFVAPAHTN
jgi:hypothetical protein